LVLETPALLVDELPRISILGTSVNNPRRRQISSRIYRHMLS
jgi:hypothetical protein